MSAHWVYFGSSLGYGVTRAESLQPVWRDAPEIATSNKANGIGQAIRLILTSRQFWPVLLVSILINPCVYFSVNWLPTYFSQQRGLSTGNRLGIILTAVYLGLDLGNLAGGFMVLGLVRRGWQPAVARRTAIVVGSTGIACCAIVPSVSGLLPAVAALALFNFGLGIWVDLYLTMAQEVSATGVSTAVGILSGCGSLAGAVAMWGVGVVTQATASFVLPMTATAVIAIVAGATAWRINKEAILAMPQGVQSSV